MKRIVLACNAGMSTSLLVTKMQEYAKEQKLDYEIYAIPESSVDAELKAKDGKIDAILLGPQIRYKLNNIKETVGDANIVVELIDMQDYGMMNGKNVIDKIKDKI